MGHKSELIDPTWRHDTYDCFGDMIERLSSARYAWPKRPSVDEGDGRVKFTGTRTFPEAMKLARHGWTEGRDKLATQLDAARFIQVGATVRAETLDVAGAYPFVPAAVAGDPMCMFAPGLEQAKTRPIFRFLVSMSIAGGIDRHVIINRGAAILSWIDKLESEGARCELILVFSASHHGKPSKFSVTCTAKRADEPLEIDRLAFVFAHPSMLRRLIFACFELHKDLGHFYSSYGHPDDSLPPDVRTPHSIYFGALSYDGAFTTIATALDGVATAIAKAQRHEDLENA